MWYVERKKIIHRITLASLSHINSWWVPKVLYKIWIVWIGGLPKDYQVYLSANINKAYKILLIPLEFTLYFKSEVLLLFFHNSHTTPEFTDWNSGERRLRVTWGGPIQVCFLITVKKLHFDISFINWFTVQCLVPGVHCGVYIVYIVEYTFGCQHWTSENSKLFPWFGDFYP